MMCTIRPGHLAVPRGEVEGEIRALLPTPFTISKRHLTILDRAVGWRNKKPPVVKDVGIMFNS
jgi:hypothetical protein